MVSFWFFPRLQGLELVADPGQGEWQFATLLNGRVLV